MPVKHSGSPLYAMYVQATRTRPVTKTSSRKQWIVFPPFPDEVAKTVQMSGRDELLVFTREQQSLENRVKWQHYSAAQTLLERDLPEKLEALARENENLKETYHWHISPVLVCQVTVDEYATLLKNPTTPYFALKRFEKIARRKHGLSI